MRRIFGTALIALNLCTMFALPQNKAEAGAAAESEAAVAKAKGSLELLNMMADDSYVTTCDATECQTVKVIDAKGATGIVSVAAPKGDEEISAVLAPTLATMQESMKGLNAQKVMLANLQQEMAQLSSTFNKGAELAESAKGRFAEAMMRSVSFTPVKGPALAAAPPPYKGTQFAAPPSKGVSPARSMQLEAAMCPMTIYELGKTQKLLAETKSQLDTQVAMNSLCNREKMQLQSALAAAEALKRKAEEQATYNARYAAEQKNKADALALALAQANSKNAALENQKAALETQLTQTQNALAQERQENQALSSALSTCNVEKAQLQAEKDALSQELARTQNTLAATQRALVEEQSAHQQTRRQLAATQQELEATEAARQQLEEAKQQLEDELAETKQQLEGMTAERDQLQVELAATSDALEQCSREKMQCQVDLAQEKALTSQLSSQLQDAMDMLTAEKQAREELTQTIRAVQAASEKIQQEVQRLQTENVQLMQQIAKLKSEQEAAMALAAGCPPTYEKFGKSCYKYVREKTQWKMAQEQCMKDSGNLVSIESRQEQAFLVDYLKRHDARYDDKYAHVGGFDYNANGVFSWMSTKVPVNYGDAFWLPMNPRGKGRRCLALQLHEMEEFGKWADEYCWVSLPFVCEVQTY